MKIDWEALGVGFMVLVGVVTVVLTIIMGITASNRSNNEHRTQQLEACVQLEDEVLQSDCVNEVTG